jgi:hypothetical protein
VAYKLSVPLEQRVNLLDIDSSGETYIVVRQPTQKQRMAREQFVERETTRQYSLEDGRQMGISSPITFEERRAYEIFLTMVECNVLDTDGETPLFPTRELNGKKSLALTWEQFQKAIGKIVDDALVEALHNATLEVEPTWDYHPNVAKPGEA